MRFRSPRRRPRSDLFSATQACGNLSIVVSTFFHYDYIIPICSIVVSMFFSIIPGTSDTGPQHDNHNEVVKQV